MRKVTSAPRCHAEPLERRVLLSAAEMVADLAPGTPGSSPNNMVELNGTLLFIANDGVRGSELWRSDGTAEGTTIVKDLLPGSGGGLTNSWLLAFNGKVYFAADDGVNGVELWKTDGTADGTVIVKDINPGSVSSTPGLRFTDDDRTRLVVGGTLYFRAADATGALELWKSDGTRKGTVQVTGAATGNSLSDVGHMAAFGDKLLFTARLASAPAATTLLVSDGTAAGTVALNNPTTTAVDPDEVTVHNGYAYYFNRVKGTAGYYPILRRTDGTPGGTTTFGPTLTGSVAVMASAAGKLYVVIHQFGSGAYELFNVNDTTGALTQILPAVGDIHFAQNFTELNGLAYFAAGHSARLWRSDGTSAGTMIVGTVKPDVAVGRERKYARLGDGLAFFGADASGPRALWTSDGTAPGTNLIGATDLPALDVSNPFPMRAVGQTLYFVANAPLGGAELWKSDGTAAGTVLVKEINTAGISSTGVVYGGDLVGRAYFAGEGGTQLWRTDGTAAGTARVTDLFGVTDPPLSPADFKKVGNLLYFTARLASTSGTRWLFRSDGTPAGSYALRPATGAVPTSAAEIVDAGNGWVYFTASSSAAGRELWRTDGTLAGTTVVADINPGTGSSSPSGLVAVGARVYFVAAASTSGGTGRELFVSDGTAAGTGLVKDVFPGATSSNPRDLTVAGGSLYFIADGLEGTTALWRSDGTTGGTAPLVSLTYTLASTLRSVGGRLVFLRSDPDTGREWWVTDGTPAGTTILRDIVPGPGSSKIEAPFLVGNILYFRANDVDHGAELWRTDGTAAGTALVADVSPGLDGGQPNPVFGANGVLLFRATDPARGTELWRTDGTPAGTFVTADVNPGPGNGFVNGFMLANGVLYFSADDGVHGTELWKYTALPTALHAEAGGGYDLAEGQSVALSSLGSTGPIASYQWDFDYDPAGGFQVDAAGPAPAYAAADGNSVHVVALRITAADGSSDIDTAVVRISNVLPVVGMSGSAGAVAGQPYVLNLTYADPGQDAPTSWQVEWGDGVIETLPGATTAAAHAYAAAGYYDVVARAADEDGGPYTAAAAGVTIGGLDPSFGAGGVVRPPDTIVDLIALPGGGSLALGVDFSIFKYRPDGSPDPTFGGGDGAVLAGVDAPSRGNNNSASAIAVGPDGRIVAVGGTAGVGISAGTGVIAAFGADGTPVPGFPAAPFPFQGMVRDLAFLPDGRLLIAGSHFGLILVARYLPTGALDATFGGLGAGTGFGGEGWVGFKGPNSANAGGYATTARILPDGKIFVGAFDNYNDDSFIVYRLSAGGAPDPTFGVQGNGRFDWKVTDNRLEPGGYAVQADGKVLAVATATASNSIYPIVMARFDANGRPDESFGVIGVATVTSGTATSRAPTVAVDPTGRILVAATIGNGFALLRFRPDGSADPEFGAAGRVVNAALAPQAFRAVLQGDGRILVGGTGVIARFMPSPVTVRVAAAAPPDEPVTDPSAPSPVPTGGITAPAPTPLRKTEDKTKPGAGGGLFSTTRVSPAPKPKPVPKPPQRARR